MGLGSLFSVLHSMVNHKRGTHHFPKGSQRTQYVSGICVILGDHWYPGTSSNSRN